VIRLAGVVAAGGVVVFPSDTVYGLACDPLDPVAVERVYALKGRPADKPAAVMYFSREAVDLEVGERTSRALDALLPGPVTLLLPNPSGRFPLACGPDPSTIGLRVPDMPEMKVWRRPILQTSANLAGGPDARRLADVPASIREGADLAIDGGELPGVPSRALSYGRLSSAPSGRSNTVDGHAAGRAARAADGPRAGRCRGAGRLRRAGLRARRFAWQRAGGRRLG
jgi:L-threonylcarbamoyladenylate synthase